MDERRAGLYPPTARIVFSAVHPRVAIVSSGAGDPYGHPASATIERLHELAVK